MGSISVGDYAILTKPGSLYRRARTSLLLELKSGVIILTKIHPMENAKDISTCAKAQEMERKQSQCNGTAPHSNNH